MKKQTKSIMENLALLSQVGIMMIIPIFAGVWIGQFLDQKFGGNSLFLIAGIVLGVGASFRNLYQLAILKGKEYKDVEMPEQYVKRIEREAKAENREVIEKKIDKNIDKNDGKDKGEKL